VRQSGNIVINATSNDRNSDALNRIVCGLTLKCMEKFPLGSLKVHFVDPSSCTWFNYFENEFGRQKSPVCKQLITNDTELIGRLDEVNTQDVAMVLKRLGANQDLYDLYKTDKTRYFHLFVIRNGFYNFAGGNSTAKLLPLLAERGRKAGVRFIIVNDYDESKSEHERNAKKQFLTDVYEKSMTLDFENGNVRFGGESLNVSRVVSDDPELFIEQRCELMAGVLNGRDEVIIPYEEIGFDRHSGVNKNSCVLSIPVAKVGNDIMEIVLNCGDEREGPANTGYVAMGRSTSGKTSFYHSLVINGARKYSPRDLEFWLLDFKENGASSNYRNAKIPHIKLLSLDSKVGDALCLFGLLVDEMTRRAKILNEVGLATRGTTFSNLNEYNEYVDNHPERGEHMSRIVVVIDEIQDIFNSENASSDEINAINNLINSISVKSRFVGIHMVIIVQNLSGKTHALKESFIRNVKGRIMFSLDEGFVNESGYGDGFKRMSSAINYLRQGEAYATNSASNPDKVKMAYCHNSKFESYFERIRRVHGSETKMRLIGNRTALLSTDNVSGTNTPYTELLSKPEVFKLYNKNGYGIVYGEDAYTLNPVKFTFNSSISSVVALGSDERLMSSICTSLLVGISHLPRKQIYVCNGLRSEEIIFNNAIANCQRGGDNVRRFKMSEIDQLVKEIYIEYLRRRRAAADEIIEDNDPIFAIINDLVSIDDVTNDYRYPAVVAAANLSGVNGVSAGNGYDAKLAMKYNFGGASNALRGVAQPVPTAPAAPAAEDPIANKTISSVIDELCQKGSAFGIYFNFSTRDLGNKFVELFKKTSNKVVFNSYTDNVSDGNYPTYLVRAILNDIQNPTEIGETAAASLFGGKVSKVRPIIYQN
jgi:hypothetical protein